jgi:large subunit ribosomal protein L4
MQLELLNDQGQAASKVDAPETVFGREYNEALIQRKNIFVSIRS